MCEYQYPVMVLPRGNFCVGLGVQASKETGRKLKFDKLLSLGGVFDGFLVASSVLGRG